MLRSKNYVVFDLSQCLDAKLSSAGTMFNVKLVTAANGSFFFAFDIAALNALVSGRQQFVAAVLWYNYVLITYSLK